MSPIHRHSGATQTPRQESLGRSSDLEHPCSLMYYMPPHPPLAKQGTFHIHLLKSKELLSKNKGSPVKISDFVFILTTKAFCLYSHLLTKHLDVGHSPAMFCEGSIKAGSAAALTPSAAPHEGINLILFLIKSLEWVGATMKRLLSCTSCGPARGLPPGSALPSQADASHPPI